MLASAGGFKWREDEYYNRFGGGLMASPEVWQQKMKANSLLKNAPASLGMRTTNSNLAPPGHSPLKKEIASAWADSNVGLPRPVSQTSSRHTGMSGRSSRRGTPPRANTPPGIIRGALYGDRSPKSKEGSLGDTGGELGSLMERSWSSPSDLFGKKERPMIVNAWGVTPPRTPSSSQGRRRPIDGSVSQFGVDTTPVVFPGLTPVPYTTNQLYGMRQAEAPFPSNLAERCRKMKTCSSVVMGL
mmetsp:Transcript_40966/g.72037  ORF Transcript_40966/g.72037 Transcript_40966/m.72037 type:complete len:243 (+) Transcript_40966:78-806(+)